MKQHAICTIFAIGFVCCAPKTPPGNDVTELDVQQVIDVTRADVQSASEDASVADRNDVIADSQPNPTDAQPVECTTTDVLRRFLSDQTAPLHCGTSSFDPSASASDNMIRCVADAWMSQRPFWVYAHDRMANSDMSYALIGRQTAHGFECVQLIAHLGPEGTSELQSLDVVRSRLAPSLERRTYNGPDPLHQGEFFATGLCPADPTYSALFPSEVAFDPPRSVPVGRACPRAR
jgi:hypothetical protein